MVQWTILKDEDGNTAIHYNNWKKRAFYDCGTVEGSVSDDSMLQWILDTGGPSPGDFVKLSDGKYLQFTRYYGRA